MFPMAELMMMFIPVPIKAKFFVPIIVGLDLFSGVTGFSIFSGGGNIAHFAHIGGALTGFLFMMLWRNNKFTHTRWN
jgi:membrane associated rhomboid family serine protease